MPKRTTKYPKATRALKAQLPQMSWWELFMHTKLLDCYWKEKRNISPINIHKIIHLFAKELATRHPRAKRAYAAVLATKLKQ